MAKLDPWIFATAPSGNAGQCNMLQGAAFAPLETTRIRNQVINRNRTVKSKLAQYRHGGFGRFTLLLKPLSAAPFPSVTQCMYSVHPHRPWKDQATSHCWALPIQTEEGHDAGKGKKVDRWCFSVGQAPLPIDICSCLTKFSFASFFFPIFFFFLLLYPVFLQSSLIFFFFPSSFFLCSQSFTPREFVGFDHKTDIETSPSHGRIITLDLHLFH